MILWGWALAGCSWITPIELADRMDRDLDGVPNAEDCAPDDPTIGGPTAGYIDADRDGYGSDEPGQSSCEDIDGTVDNNDDCNDIAPETFPGSVEVCDGQDNDCDEDVDEDPVDASTWYPDTDGDTYGDESQPVEACEAPADHVARGGDCDDTDFLLNPEQPERCEDGLDNNCDGLVDASDWYLDEDDDAWGRDDVVLRQCDHPDGHVLVPGDCDDSDPQVNPSRGEVCDPEDQDEDCDGIVDDSDPSVTGQDGWYTDADGDGHGDPLLRELWCDPPSGLVSDGDDCDDTDASISPSAVEVWYDGVDTDCDGWDDEDADKDGYVVTDDCDDDDDEIHPDATEVCGDGIDNDCDEVQLGTCAISGELELADGDFELRGELTYHNDLTGSDLFWPGDLDGDGQGDLVIEARNRYDASGVPVGAVLVQHGPVTADGDLAGADAVIWGDKQGQFNDLAYTTGEDLLTGGLSSLVIGIAQDDTYAPSAGAVWLFNGDVSGTATEAQASARIFGTAEYDGLGQAVAWAGDQDGDGQADLWVASPGQGSTGSYAPGAVLLYEGPLSGDQTDEDAVARLEGVGTDDRAANALATADFDGDGVHDVAVGVRDARDSHWVVGGVYIVLGPVEQDASLADADSRWTGGTYEYAGQTLAALTDSDGDGLADLIIGSPYADSGQGGAYLLLDPGSTSGGSLSHADAVLTSAVPGAGLGYTVATAGDLNGDGRTEVAVTAPSWYETSGYTEGAVFIHVSPFSGTRTEDDAEGTIRGGDNSLDVGIGGGDLNGDGMDDVFVSDGSYWPEGFLYQPPGSVLVFLGGPYE